MNEITERGLEKRLPNDPQEAAQRFFDEVLAAEIAARRGVLVGLDRLSAYFGKDYDPQRMWIYRKAAFMLYEQVVKESPAPSVLFTAGGAGSGKTELIVEPVLKEGVDCVICDSTFTVYEGARAQIQIARAAGKKISIVAILSNLEAARRFTVIRERETGRGVSDSAFASGHAAFSLVIRRLLEENIIESSELSVLDFRNIRSTSNVREVVAHTVRSKQQIIDLLKEVVYDEASLAIQYAKEHFSGIKE